MKSGDHLSGLARRGLLGGLAAGMLGLGAMAPLVCGQEEKADAEEAAEKPVEKGPELDLAGPDRSDPFSSSAGDAVKISPKRSREKRQGFQVRMETWEVDAAEMALRMDRGGKDWLEKLREDCLKKPADYRLVFSPVVAADERTPQRQENTVEEIYPTEWEPPDLSIDAAKKPEEKATELQKWAAASGHVAFPTSFETRNTGHIFEVTVLPVEAEAQQGPAGLKWDLKMSFCETLLQKNVPWGVKELQVTEPRFTTYRVEGLFRMQTGKWRLISVAEPPRDESTVVSPKRWVTLVRMDAE